MKQKFSSDTVENSTMSPRAAWVILLAIACCMAGMAESYAAVGTDTPMGYVLCNVVYMVYGNLGRGLITLAIVVVGVAATLGKVQWGMAMTVAIGCSIVANAGNIMLLLLPQLVTAAC